MASRDTEWIRIFGTQPVLCSTCGRDAQNSHLWGAGLNNFDVFCDNARTMKSKIQYWPPPVVAKAPIPNAIYFVAEQKPQAPVCKCSARDLFDHPSRKNCEWMQAKLQGKEVK